MWRSHMVVGESSWLALQALAGPLTGDALDWRERVCGAVIAAGGALVCDLDTPDSRLSNALGPITRLGARGVGRVFGGHRQGTHSLAFCAAVGALTAIVVAQGHMVQLGGHLTLNVGELAALLIAYAATALTVALLLPVRGARAGVITLTLVVVAASTHPPAAIVSAALTIGCCSHDWRESVVVLLTAVVTIAIAWSTR